MAHPFTVQRSAEGELTVLSLDGYLDAHTAPEFERALQKEIESDRCGIIVDCRRLTYISSAGLGVFMGFIEDVRDKGGDIKICGLTPKVKQVFDLLGFQQLYHILDSVPDAVQKFSEAPVWKE